MESEHPFIASAGPVGSGALPGQTPQSQDLVRVFLDLHEAGPMRDRTDAGPMRDDRCGDRCETDAGQDRCEDRCGTDGTIPDASPGEGGHYRRLDR